MPRLSGAAPSRPAHLSRRRHPAPWSQQPGGEIQSVTLRRSPEPEPLPVFVDESGRRRRVGQLLGVSLGTLVLGYVVVVALTFGGAPVVGSFAPPGLGDLSRPAGDDGPGVGSGAQVSPLPTAGAPAAAPAVGGAATPGQAPAADDADPPDSSATTATSAPPPPSTTTTAPPGQGTTTSAPVPNSTVPDHTPPTGGPPTDPPGKP